MSAYMYAKCCVPSCKSSSRTTHLHHFPKDDKIRSVWKENVGNENIMKLTLPQLKNFYVCHLHFEPQYRSKVCGHLKRAAIPTIFFAASDHSDVESVFEDGQSDGEGEKTSLIDKDVEKIKHVEPKEGVLTETVEGVKQPLIASMADEYESMCMEIIGDFPEGAPSPKETRIAVKVKSEAQQNELLPHQNPIVNTSDHRKPRSTFSPTWRPPEDTYDKEHIAAAVIDTNHPLGHFSVGMETLLRKHLYQLLDEAALNSDENFDLPRFCGCSYHDGIFQVQCVDRYARDWLAQAVSLLPGENLSVVSVQVPAPLVRASVWVPDDVTVVTEIKQRLDQYAAHQGINTRDWRVFQHISKEKPKGTLLVLGMPSADVACVKEKGGRLLYRLNALKVNFWGHKNPSRDEEPWLLSATKTPPP